jgi:2-polyprenyl-6-methoxyphenol hydroxylase-like FAD-dependent oxidoreductase
MTRNAILIVGAGPTGLTAALELARRGFYPRVIDKDDGPTQLSKAVGISAHSLDLLEPAGVTERLLAEGVKVGRAHFYFEGRELGIIRFDGLPHRFNFLLSLPQAETETIMAEALRRHGIDVEWRSRLSGLSADGGALETLVQTPSGERTEHFDAVFGADGAKSAVRQSLGLAFKGYTHDRTWSIADVELADWPYEPGAAHAFLHRNGDVGFIIPIGRGRHRAVSNTPDAMARIPGRYRVARTLIADTFPLPVRQAPTYQKDGAYLGGDAAHVHSPLGARGMNLGIEDAAAFARRLSEGALDGYTAERHPIGKRWIGLSESVLSVAEADNPLVVALRNVVLRAVGHWPLLQRPMLKRVSGLTE